MPVDLCLFVLFFLPCSCYICRWMDRKEHDCLQVYGPCLLSVGSGMMWNDSVAKATGWRDDPRRWPPSLSDCHVKDLRPMQGRNRMRCLWKLHRAVWNVTFTADLSRLSGFAKLMILRKVLLGGFKDVDLRFDSFRCFHEFGGTLQDRIFLSNGLPFLCAFCLVFPLPSMKLVLRRTWSWQGLLFLPLAVATCTCPCGRPELISCFKFCFLYTYVKSQIPLLCLVHYNIVYIAGI